MQKGDLILDTSTVFSLQTGEMGLTQSVGDEGVKFEVWVRQAPRTRDCITLQAHDREGRVAWTHDIAHLLWTHAINNTGTLLLLTPEASTQKSTFQCHKVFDTVIHVP